MNEREQIQVQIETFEEAMQMGVAAAGLAATLDRINDRLILLKVRERQLTRQVEREARQFVRQVL